MESTVLNAQGFSLQFYSLEPNQLFKKSGIWLSICTHDALLLTEGRNGVFCLTTESQETERERERERERLRERERERERDIEKEK